MSLWVKLCGINSEAAIEGAVAAGADAVGIVLSPSVRRVDLESAARLVALAGGAVTTVAVMYRPDRSLLDRARAEVPFDLFQAEPGHLGDLPATVSLPVIHDGDGLADAVRQACSATSGNGRPSALVESSGHGGFGSSPDWERVSAIDGIADVAVAGGLTVENVGGVIARLSPGGVDVSSGIEASPGEKDPELMKRFVDAARAAAGEVI